MLETWRKMPGANLLLFTLGKGLQGLPTTTRGQPGLQV